MTRKPSFVQFRYYIGNHNSHVFRSRRIERPGPNHQMIIKRFYFGTSTSSRQMDRESIYCAHHLFSESSFHLLLMSLPKDWECRWEFRKKWKMNFFPLWEKNFSWFMMQCNNRLSVKMSPNFYFWCLGNNCIIVNGPMIKLV